MRAINSWIKRNPLWTALICILAVVALTGFISVQTNGFNNPEDLFTRDTNPDNLLIPGEDGNYLLVEAKGIDEGLTVTPKDNGALLIKGPNKHTAAASDVFSIAELTLPAGEYTLSSGYKDTSIYGAYLVAETASGELAKADLGASKGTFTLEAETVVTITLHVCPSDTNWNVTMYPVLVEGKTAGSFWA